MVFKSSLPPDLLKQNQIFSATLFPKTQGEQIFHTGIEMVVHGRLDL